MCSAIAALNLFYNNLFINLRFRCKMHCGKIGFCCFDIFGRLLCDCCLMRLCRDKMITVRTVVKWIVTTVVFFDTHREVRSLTNRWEHEFLVGTVVRHDHNLEVYLLLYWAQHIIFIIARIPIFFVYQILTCFCDRGNDFYEDSKFEDTILSFDYIGYEKGEIEGQGAQPVGQNEIEFRRRL